ncbi:Sel1 repeat-containing protein 1 [Tupaia chinensis]|uniref:Cytochrome c oxidase assembly factor 7 n=1 Tax=Tupaia chinensis TaxID=246437 RepID=L9KRP6_TUPCH|nr:Sel1 repeat-containing protein 1 [Tupaia chinensis]
MAGLVDFQDEEQVKSFLENMEVECNYQCYREKDPDGERRHEPADRGGHVGSAEAAGVTSGTGCYRLVDYLEGIQKNFDEAAKVLKFNCEENKHSESCYKLGAYHVTGKGGVSRDLKAASSCFLMACEKPGKKSVEACHNVGLLAHDGQANEDGQPDLGKARDYYTKACDGGYAPSCFNLSVMFLQGTPAFPKDMSLASKYSMKACDLGHVWACANASRMYKLGDGVDKDEAKAEVLKNRARQLHKEQQKSVQPLTFG